MTRRLTWMVAVAAMAAPAARAQDYKVELSGTVREFQFSNPHCYIQLSVPNDRGGIDEWAVEMGAPSHLRGAGWKKSTLKAGDRVRVTIAPLRDGRRGGELVRISTPDGRSLLS